MGAGFGRFARPVAVGPDYNGERGLTQLCDPDPMPAVSVEGLGDTKSHAAPLTPECPSLPPSHMPCSHDVSILLGDDDLAQRVFYSPCGTSVVSGGEGGCPIGRDLDYDHDGGNSGEDPAHGDFGLDCPPYVLVGGRLCGFWSDDLWGDGGGLHVPSVTNSILDHLLRRLERLENIVQDPLETSLQQDGQTLWMEP